MLTRFERISSLLLLLLAFAGLPVTARAANNPVPLINQPLAPDAVMPGGPAFTLIVNGSGFVSSSVVNWNGSARTTTYVSGSQVRAAITAADIATTGTASVTVVNPTPGGGTSNIAFLSITVPTSFVTFSVASSPATGDKPYSVAVGDFNGDGKLDLAVANYGSNLVSVFLGDGTGNFTLASSLGTAQYPDSVAVGDFNGDGNLDIAVANVCGIPNCDGQTPGAVTVYLGDGTGNFTPAPLMSPSTGFDPVSMVVGDFNRDGNIDLAVANEGSDTVSIFLGDGNGNLTLTSSPATGLYPESIAMGDFNGDGNLDLAVANAGSSTASILLGDGTGNFTLGSSLGMNYGTRSVAAGDFNGDGKLDLAFANDTGIIYIFLGDGTGNFSLASSSAAGSFPISVAIDDFNGDGKLDLAVANEGSDTVSIFLGDGNGNLTLASSPGVGRSPQSIAVGDFNGDGRLDLAAANEQSDTVSILVQSPGVTLSSTRFTFGDQNLGTVSAPMSSTLTNTGSAPLTLAISITGQNATDFSQANTCGMVVFGGASCTISVTFAPSAPGMRTASVSITDNAPGSPQMIALSGTGTAPAVTLSPASLYFGSTTSAGQVVTLMNTGTEILTISSISTSGNFSQTNTCAATVGVGASCAITVKFAPTIINQQTGALTITDNAYDNPQQTVPLTGTGTEVKVAPASVAFPVQLVGTSSVAKQVTLTNVGATALAITGITVTGADAEDFAQTNTCGSSVGAGGSCAISITFTPTGINTRTAQVSVSDNGGGSPQTVPLKGIGTIVKFSASSLNFGNVMVGKVSQPQIVMLTNIGVTTLSITSIKVTGAEHGDFSASNTCGKELNAGASCSINMHFIPTQMGARMADVSISDNGGGSPQKIKLSGTGT